MKNCIVNDYHNSLNKMPKMTQKVNLYNSIMGV